MSHSALVDAVHALARCRDHAAILTVVTRYVRRLVGADGATFALLTDGECRYLEEDAIAPLWKGRRFPAGSCIGGWVAAHKVPAVVPDVFSDPRVPHGAYRATFVRSLAVVPVRPEDPLGTIGAYWRAEHRATPEQVETLQALADAASVAWTNAALIRDLSAARDQAEARATENARLLTERTAQLEVQARAEAERDRLRELLQQSRKMDALGRMVAGVAHDFNNLLTVIIGFGEVLQASAGPPTQDLAVHIVEAGLRGQALTGQLLRFARAQPFTPEPLDLNRVVADAQPLVARLVGRAVRVTLEPTADLPPVSADPVQIGQVLLNLASNARDAMPEGGRFTLATVPGSLPDGAPAVCLRVSDTGCGMTDDVRTRLFEPFFTTKETGTGLGMSIVADVVARHGGALSMDTVPGSGTTFRICLPVCSGHSPPPSAY
ncbi:ATP-binding protein [Gemmata sp. JC717]|uniref:ATP-binding protein n=1 Tax=Gemmata algarum TaxID=2975278 RepID=UPI0021BB4602|nr:ATP-binding protein [Gemmata algarum]MDY3555056.1 ATP-binding protein [Gemmata algarum]